MQWRKQDADACDLLRGTIPSRQRSCLAHNPEHSPCCQVKHPTQHWGENAGPCSSVFVFLPAQASTDTTLRQKHHLPDPHLGQQAKAA
ncbi:hypothetical protein AV530_000788 [Patagioenas fasciata monilis]|uniref:Uncharacterized protein n=1 Tax=Patagioenas fasciata monilis TaxID=372326 RepID=A0A1V4KTU0_PATFA|nr:hypothetical protein AV530_000788 [Patagioenas fasciata monilis]